MYSLCDEAGDVATASLLENWIDETEKRNLVSLRMRAAGLKPRNKMSDGRPHGWMPLARLRELTLECKELPMNARSNRPAIKRPIRDQEDPVQPNR